MHFMQKIKNREAVAGITGPGYGGWSLGQDTIVCDLH